MEQTVSQSVAPRRFSMLLLTVFAVAALALHPSRTQKVSGFYSRIFRRGTCQPRLTREE